MKVNWLYQGFVGRGIIIWVVLNFISFVIGWVLYNTHLLPEVLLNLYLNALFNLTGQVVLFFATLFWLSKRAGKQRLQNLKQEVEGLKKN